MKKAYYPFPIEYLAAGLTAVRYPRPHRHCA